MPCLLTALLLIVALGCAGIPSFAGNGDGTHAHLLIGALSVIGFFHNILMQKLGYFNYCLNIYWSLSIEEVFYIGLPLVCMTLRRDTLIVVPCLVLIVVAPFYRAAHADNDIDYLYANWACFDAIAIGCLTAMLSQVWTPSRFAAPLTILGCATLAFTWFRGFGGTHMILGFTYVAIATATIIVASLDQPVKTAPAWSPLRAIRWLGRHSYELYLFHIIVLAAMRDLVPGDELPPAWQIPWLGVFLFASCLTAREISRRLSEPANHLIRKSLLREAPAAASPVPQ